MTEDVAIEEIKKLQPKPGDVVALRVSKTTPVRSMYVTMDRIAEILPKGVPVILLYEDMKLEQLGSEAKVNLVIDLMKTMNNKELGQVMAGRGIV